VKRLCVLGFLCVLVVEVSAQMDFRQASGIPRPVDDLPPGTVSVRVIRGDLSNPIANQPVELIVGDDKRVQNTDSEGRAEFVVATSGTVRAATTVDGERLESQTFPAPTTGGVRLLLVATDPETAAREAEALKNAVVAPVVLGRESQIVVEPDDEIVRIYYVLDILNTQATAVRPPEPFAFDLPAFAQGATIVEGPEGRAGVTGRTVRVEGPFPPGSTPVQVAYVADAGGGSVEIEQPFPVTLEHLAVIVRKVGDARLSSPQIARQQEMPASGQTFIAAAGQGAIPAGQPVQLTISGLPHHSQAPRWIALGIALTITLIGIFAARRPEPPETRAAERKRLVARREKLFQDLVRLEQDHRRGRLDAPRYASRREDLIAALEHVYGALESDDTGVAA
jgi:hypothetical protein